MKTIVFSTLALVAASFAPAQQAPSHPSLFFGPEDLPAIRERADSTEWLRAMKQAVIERAEYFLDTPTQPYPLESKDNGKGTAGRFLQHRLGVLALAGYFTESQAYFDKGVEILLAAVRQFEPDNPDHWRTHLQYSDATQALAIGYDFLYPHLSDSERAEVRAELFEYGNQIFTDRNVWGAPSPGVTSGNHNSVQFGALGLAALALGDQPAWTQRATDRVRGFYQYFADPTGYVTEGHHYLSYGQLGAYPFSLALKRSGGPDLVAEQPVTAEINDQFVWVLLPFDSKIRTLNDNDPQPIGPIATAYALNNQRPVQLWAWWQAIGPQGNGRNGIGLQNDGFGEIFPFISGPGPLEPISPGQANWPLSKRYESGRVFMRSAWDDPMAAHVVFKSGYDRHQGHNQQDENSVAFAALGEDFLTDPGYWPDSSDSHTTLKINGVEQQVGSVGRVVDFRDEGHGVFARGQAPEAYPLIPGFIGHAQRMLYFVRGPHPYLIWRDDVGVEVGHDPFEVVSRYITLPENKLEKRDKGAVIKGANGRSSCLLLAYSDDQPLDIVIDDLEGKHYIANASKKVVYSEHFQRLSATTHSRHPRLVTIAFPFLTESEIPEVTIHFDPASETHTCALNFPDGRVDTIVFDATNASFSQAR